MNESRIAALNRLVDEYRAGLSRCNEADWVRLVDELLDEVDLLRTLFMQQHFGVKGTPQHAAMVESFEEVF